MGGGGAPESELFAQELVAFDGCRGRESYFSFGHVAIINKLPLPLESPTSFPHGQQ